ncbi:hypothetical protein V8E54_008510 [Elaphomyces granulatus]
MSVRSPSRGRSRTRSLGFPHSNSASHRSVSALPDPKPRTRSVSSQSLDNRRNGYRGRSWSRSPSRNREYSRSQSAGRGGRWPRDRTYARSPSPRIRRRSSKIVVEKLTKNVTEDHLFEIFGSFGEIQNLDLPMNRAFMTNRGTAYILYYDAADAESAISHMHEAQLDGAVLNVSIVLPRRTFSRSPPPIRQSRADIGHSTYGRVASGSHRGSPPRRISPPRRYGVHRMTERHDIYRPRSRSRSRSPRRSRPYSPRSASRSPSRREHPRRESPRRRRRRSPSYSSYSSANSYSSFSDRSRSPSRS